MVTRTEKKKVDTLSLLKEILKPIDEETDEQPDTTDMYKLESEESAEKIRNQKGVGFKILTPDQRLSRLSVILAQLKAGTLYNNLINAI